VVLCGWVWWRWHARSREQTIEQWLGARPRLRLDVDVAAGEPEGVVV
jgi:hypothetical protein